MLVDKQYSALHILKSDETWHFYEGTALILIHILDMNGILKTVKLGNPIVDEEANLSYTVERN